MEDENISFSYVTNLLVSDGQAQVWVRMFALSPNLEHIELVKKQIEKGNEAMATLNRLEKYYQKESVNAG